VAEIIAPRGVAGAAGDAIVTKRIGFRAGFVWPIEVLVELSLIGNALPISTYRGGLKRALLI
jgi:hypothetical protein